eukprot:5918286-Prymnesium_polylepis.1
MPRVSLPHRIYQLGPNDPALLGRPTSTAKAAADLRQAHAMLEQLHSAPCELGTTKILFKRMPVAGISHDINSLVRSLAVAWRDGRQLVLLPPTAAKRAKLRRTAGEVGVHRPWHWLPEGVPLSSLLHPSACQRRLRRTQPGLMDAIGNGTDALHFSCNISATCERGLIKDHDVAQKWFVEINTQAIPKVLTTFLVRINGQLARSIRAHPALM